MNTLTMKWVCAFGAALLVVAGYNVIAATAVRRLARQRGVSFWSALWHFRAWEAEPLLGMPTGTLVRLWTVGGLVFWIVVVVAVTL